MRWQCCHRRVDLGCQAATPAPEEGVRRPGRLSSWSWRSVMSECLPCRSSVPCPRRFGSGGVPGGVDGVRPDATGHAVSETCPIVASIVDAGHDRADIGRGPGLRTFLHRAWVQVVMTGGSLLVAAGWPKEHAHCRAVRSGPGRAGRVDCRGRMARRLGVGGVRRLAVTVRTGSRPIGWAVTSNWGCPADRTVKRSAMSVGRPATARVSAGRTDRRRRCPGGCPATAPWRKPGGQPDCGMSGTPRRSPRGATGDRGLGGWADERLRRGGLLPPPIGPTEEGGRGGSAGIGERLASVGAGGRAGALLGGGWSRRGLIGSRRANRSARLAGVEPNIKKPIGHTPLANQNSTSCPFIRPY